jgi:PAS domain-containing protein
MLEEFMTQFDYQLQIGLMVLIAVMAALTWRAHRQVSKLSATSAGMQESLGTLEESTRIVEVLSTAMANTLFRLETATDEITASTSETEKTLRSNLEEYRMAAGSTSAYRDYLQRMGMAPASDVEPILEAFSDGAAAVGTDGRILYANHALADLTSISPGDTLQEVLDRCQMRTFGGESLDIEEMPESRVLSGEKIESILVRMRPRGRDHDVILSVNGQPARDPAGRVVAAVMLSRPISEEVAMAIEVRRLGEHRPGLISGAA